MDNLYEIYFGYIHHLDDSGGEERPVIILGEQEDRFIVFKITSRFDRKSDQIQNNFYAIKDLHEAGLKMKSYIDTGEVRIIEKRFVQQIFGKLSQLDRIALKDFTNQKNKLLVGLSARQFIEKYKNHYPHFANRLFSRGDEEAEKFSTIDAARQVELAKKYEKKYDNPFNQRMQESQSKKGNYNYDKAQSKGRTR